MITLEYIFDSQVGLDSPQSIAYRNDRTSPEVQKTLSIYPTLFVLGMMSYRFLEIKRYSSAYLT